MGLGRSNLMGLAAMAAAAMGAVSGAAEIGMRVQADGYGIPAGRSRSSSKDSNSGRNRRAAGAGMASIRVAKKKRNQARHRAACKG